MEFRCLRAHIRQMDQEWVRDGLGGGRYSSRCVDKLMALVRDHKIKDSALIEEVSRFGCLSMALRRRIRLHGSGSGVGQKSGHVA